MAETEPQANDREERDVGETHEKATMVHTLREELGSYARALEAGRR